MDRSWIYNSAPFSDPYMSAVQQFMEHVRSRFSADEEIKCPCHRCLNQIQKSQDEAEDDIHINSISRCYTRWIHHGEGDNDVDQDDGTLAVGTEDISWDRNDQAPLGDEGQVEDVIEDSAREFRG